MAELSGKREAAIRKTARQLLPLAVELYRMDGIDLEKPTPGEAAA